MILIFSINFDRKYKAYFNTAYKNGIADAWILVFLYVVSSG